MTHAIRNAEISRRGLMIGAAGLTFAVTSTGMLSGGMLSGLRGAAAQSARTDVTPSPVTLSPVTLSPWVTIATDDTVAIMSPAAEMGQGSLTSLPLILAEELDADWSKVRVVVAPPNDDLYKNPSFGFM